MNLIQVFGVYLHNAHLATLELNCSHVYSEAGEEPTNMEQCITQLFHVRCEKCGHRDYMGRQQYIQHLRDTGRLRT